MVAVVIVVESTSLILAVSATTFVMVPNGAFNSVVASTVVPFTVGASTIVVAFTMGASTRFVPLTTAPCIVFPSIVSVDVRFAMVAASAMTLVPRTVVPSTVVAITSLPRISLNDSMVVPRTVTPSTNPVDFIVGASTRTVPLTIEPSTVLASTFPVEVIELAVNVAFTWTFCAVIVDKFAVVADTSGIFKELPCNLPEAIISVALIVVACITLLFNRSVETVSVTFTLLALTVVDCNDEMVPLVASIVSVT